MRGLIDGGLGVYVGVAALTVALTACSGGDPDEEPTGSSDSTSAPADESPSAGASVDPTGPMTNLLDWEPTKAAVSNGEWAWLATNKQTAELTGPATIGFGTNPQRVSDLLLDDSFAVVVSQDPQENEPGNATVVDLGTMKQSDVGPESEVPTTNGGTWALGDGKLFHATYGPKNAYCLAEVDLASDSSAIAWCAPKNNGFNDARIAPAGLTVLSFKLGKDGCRTPVSIADGEATPIVGVTECIGWDSLVTPQGNVWSETTDLNRVEEASFFATGPDGERQELAVGDTGSLTWCGTSAYFTQQPQQDGDPARMYRWTSDGELEIVYETPGAPGFISEPSCGGSVITISSKSEGGDEQVSAPVD